MLNAKEFYRSYIADDALAAINHQLAAEVMSFNPNHCMEFGCGTGKNLKLIEKIQTNYARHNVVTIGIDVSVMNVMHAKIKHGLNYVIHGDEGLLRNMANVDVVFTCSVLDHIEDVSGIIVEFKRIANKAVIIAETNDVPGQYYFPHDYESFGFVDTGYQWVSDQPEGDGATYRIWKWDGAIVDYSSVDDDLAKPKR